MFDRLRRQRAQGSGSLYEIRKDAGELTLADWDLSPVWEFCLDEHDQRGQTECTVRPGPAERTLEPLFDGGVACSLRLACGKLHRGVVWLGSPELNSSTNVELWLERPVSQLPGGWDPVVGNGRRVSFLLPVAEHFPDDVVKDRIRTVYAAVGEIAERVWPMVVKPKVAIKGWPDSWHIDGWRRPDGRVMR